MQVSVRRNMPQKFHPRPIQHEIATTNRKGCARRYTCELMLIAHITTAMLFTQKTHLRSATRYPTIKKAQNEHKINDLNRIVLDLECVPKHHTTN